METKEHWETVYQSKPTTEVSWFQPHAALSLELIRKADVPHSASIIDVGGGASTLTDDLIADGYRRITVLDLSGNALRAAQARLGERAEQVRWIEGDVLNASLPEHAYDVWHDRAVFHFLTDEKDRRLYIAAVLRAVKPGGLVIVATFAEDGPERCSGLPVKRYAADELHAEFGEPFTLLGHVRESHTTPAGKEQPFVYCFCRMSEEPARS